MADQKRINFRDLVGILDDGAAQAELDSALMKIARDVAMTGKPGELRLTIKFKPAAKGQNAIVASADIGEKSPRPDAASKLFYVDDDGRLSRSDPRQREIFERENLERPN